MNPITLVGIGVAVVLILMVLRVPLAFVFFFVGFCGLWYLKDLAPAYEGLVTNSFEVASSYLWTAIPMFVMMGYMAEQIGIIEGFYEAARKWVGHFPGGLAHSVILGNAGFGAVSGSSLSSAVTFSVMSLPEMRKYGYADKLTLGAVAAGAILATLIPPSITFIVYGGVTNTSIARLFMAGIIPGLLLSALYMVVIYVLCRLDPKLGPPGPKYSWMERLRSAPNVWGVALVFLIMMGGLYLGLFTPTEAGGCAAAVVILLGLAKRTLTWQGFRAAMVHTGLTTGMLFFLLMGVRVFNLFVVMSGATQSMAQFMVGFSQSPLVFLFFISVVYLFLGCFLDAMGVFLLTIPMIFPVSKTLGIDPIALGVLCVILIQVGSLTPPYGTTVFAIAGIIKDVPMYTIFRGVGPFLIACVACIVLIIFFPQIATWLPSMMMPLK